MAIFIFMLPLLPVLIPATITAFHALAGSRRRWTNSRAARDRIVFVELVPASA